MLLLAAGCSAASSHSPAATASTSGGAVRPAAQASSAPWADPSKNLAAEDGVKLIARSGKRTLNGYQGAGTLTVTVGSSRFTYPCTKCVVRAVAVAWSPRVEVPQDS